MLNNIKKGDYFKVKLLDDGVYNGFFYDKESMYSDKPLKVDDVRMVGETFLISNGYNYTNDMIERVFTNVKTCSEVIDEIKPFEIWKSIDGESIIKNGVYTSITENGMHELYYRISGEITLEDAISKYPRNYRFSVFKNKNMIAMTIDDILRLIVENGGLDYLKNIKIYN